MANKKGYRIKMADNKKLKKLLDDIREARKDPKFMKEIRQFIKATT